VEIDAGTIDPPVTGRRRGRRRWLWIGILMLIAWLVTDAGLEVVNQATGLISRLKPVSFVIGPLVAVGVGRVGGLRARADWMRALLLMIIGFVAVVSGTIALSMTQGARGVGPNLATLDFGVGGEGCDLERSARQFAPGDPVVAAAEFTPPIAAGSTITIRMTRDGTMVAEYPVVQVADKQWPCVYGRVSASPLGSGRYRWEIAVSGSSMPPLAGEFTVSR
jgi:hypothetical protein